MRANQIPAKFPMPFGANAGPALIRAIPTASQIGITNGAASLNDGFPPLTGTALASGGVPPAMQDFNGIMQLMSAWDQWTAAAGLAPYDPGFSTLIGGYPQGATVLSAATTGRVWISTLDNNTVNPDSAGQTAWLPLMLSSDVLALIFANAVRILPAGATFYVSPTGNDNNDGLTTATALVTITAAARKAAALYVPGGSVNIQLIGYAGTQVLFVAPTLPSMSTPLTITGDVANPNNYRIYNPSGGVIGVSGLNVNLVGLQPYNQGNTYNTLSVSSGTVTLNQVNFSGIGGNNFAHIALFAGGVLNINGNVQFQCNAQTAISMSGGVLTAGSAPGTVISTSVALTFQYILRLTKLAAASFAPSTVTWSGSFTGQKYLIDQNSVLDCAGQASTYVPGNIAGATALGGVAN